MYVYKLQHWCPSTDHRLHMSLMQMHLWWVLGRHHTGTEGLQFHHTQFVANARCCSVCYRILPLSDRVQLWEEKHSPMYVGSTLQVKERIPTHWMIRFAAWMCVCVGRDGVWLGACMCVCREMLWDVNANCTNMLVATINEFVALYPLSSISHSNEQKHFC